LKSQVQKSANTFLDNILASSWGEEITYKQLTSKSTDPSTGQVTTNYDNYTIDVFRGNTTFMANPSTSVVSNLKFSENQDFWIFKYTDVPTSPESTDILQDKINDKKIQKVVPVQGIYVIISA